MKIIAGPVQKADLEDNNQGDVRHLGKNITIDMTGNTESSKPAFFGPLSLLCSRAEDLRKPDDDQGPLIFMVFFIFYWAVIVWYVASYPW